MDHGVHFPYNHLVPERARLCSIVVGGTRGIATVQMGGVECSPTHFSMTTPMAPSWASYPWKGC
jgi:hypothetical protein